MQLTVNIKSKECHGSVRTIGNNEETETWHRKNTEYRRKREKRLIIQRKQSSYETDQTWKL